MAAQTQTPHHTPARAIHTALSTRASSALPPPTQTFLPLVRSVLQHRLTRHILPCAAGLSWCAFSLWAVWGQKHGLSGVFRVPVALVVICVAGLAWMGAGVPVVVGKKVYLTGTRTPAASPREEFQAAMARQSTHRLGAMYVASSVVVLVLHVVLAYAYEPSMRGDPRLTVFVKSKKHPHYFNPRLLFLLLTQLATAGAFTLRLAMNDRLVFPWGLAERAHAKDAPFTRFPFTAPQLIRTLLIIPLLAPILSIPPSLAIAAAARMVLLPVAFRVPLVGALIRGVAGGIVRGSYTIFLPLIHFSLLIRAWLLAATTILLWEGSQVLFEGYVSQPIHIAHLTPNPTLTLISGVTSSPSPAQDELVFQYTAYQALLTLASSSDASAVAERTALFGDQKYAPSMWSHLCRESLLLLGRDYQHFLRRGQPAPAPAPPPASLIKEEEPLPGTPLRLVRQRVFKGKERESPVQAVLDAVAADGTLARAVEAVEERVEVPEVFRSAVPTPVRSLAASSASVSAKVVDAPKSMMEKARGCVWNWTPGQWKDRYEGVRTWWIKERISRVAKTRWLPRKELDVAAIDVLTHLVCASLTEDRYGVVQRDIPRILEALLAFLVAVEERTLEVNSLYTPPTAEDIDIIELEKKEELRLEVEQAGETLGSVGDALKEGVARIVRTFGIKLLAFKFPPRTAQKLQTFMDYC